MVVRFWNELKRQWMAGAWKQLLLAIAIGILFGFMIGMLWVG